MLASEFVKQLADIAPSEEDYVRAGHSRTQARAWREAYSCPKRDAPLPIVDSNELLTLMKGWHTGNVEIGMVRLLDEPTSSTRGVDVGVVESDPLIILSGTGELIVEDSGTDGHLLWCVAQSADRFLDALIVAARFLESRALRKDFDDLSVASATAEQCAGLAGGNQYLPFYWMLVGAQW